MPTNPPREVVEAELLAAGWRRVPGRHGMTGRPHVKWVPPGVEPELERVMAVGRVRAYARLRAARKAAKKFATSA